MLDSEANGRAGRLHDLIAIASIVSATVILGWPIVAGGFLTYMDNPVHIAELYALANGQDWAELGFLGFPLVTLHSPLFYGMITTAHKVGFSIESTYVFFLLCGAAAPALAVYAVARRAKASPAAALIPSWLLLVQQPAIVGFGSVFGGMWTYYLSLGVVVLFVLQFSDAERCMRSCARNAALLAIIGLGHLFALVVAILAVALQSTARAIRLRSRSLRPLAWDALTCVLAAATSAVYWWPQLLGRSLSGLETFTQNLATTRLLYRLTMPGLLVDLLHADRPLPAVPGALSGHAALMLLLVASGLVGAVMHRAWRRFDASGTGFYIAVLLLTLLIGIADTDSDLLGPVSWRFLYPVRIGFALASIPFFLWLSLRVGKMNLRWLTTLAVALALSCLFWRVPLQRVVPAPRGEQWENLEATWQALAARRDEISGRVFFQDTFGTGGAPRWRYSHAPVLAPTRVENLSLLGSYYGVVPYRTRRLSSGESDKLFGRSLRQLNKHPKALEDSVQATNTQVLVLSNPATVAQITRLIPRFRHWSTHGRFSIYGTDESPGWVTATTGSARATLVEPGHFEIGTASSQDAELMVKTQYHPYWTADLPGDASFSHDDWGRLLVKGLPPGEHEFDLFWIRPRMASCLSLLSALLIAYLLIHPRSPPLTVAEKEQVGSEEPSRSSA